MTTTSSVASGVSRTLLLFLSFVPGLAYAQGSVVATQTTLPGATTSVNTVAPNIQVTGALGGGIPSPGRPFSGTLTFVDAVQRGLEFNLGSFNTAQSVSAARGQQTIARSALLPNVVGDVTVNAQQLNLAA